MTLQIFIIVSDIKNLIQVTGLIEIIFLITINTCIRFYKKDYDIKSKDFIFSHGGKIQLPDNKILVSSYHPSPRNVNTGLLDSKKMISLLIEVKDIIKR